MISRHRREITLRLGEGSRRTLLPREITLRLGEGSRTRRSRVALEDAVDRATSARKKAIALYQLGLFHDNNARESVAIPLYERALRAGLENALKAQALAWLASSLYKTGGLRRALSRLRQAREIAKDRKLLKFLRGLEIRINRSLGHSSARRIS